jgi:GNAT superfamily N-acetyltransferase
VAVVTVRQAEREDCALIAELVRDLAEYEREPESAHLTADDFSRDGFGAQPAFECLIGEIDGVGCGLALFFPYYSTWEGRGIYLEDLFVRPEFRGLGLGKALLAEVARITVARGAVRLDWSVLAWNEPALSFYASLGAERLEEWRKMRLSGEVLTRVADPMSQTRDMGHPHPPQMRDLGQSTEAAEVEL